MDGGARATATFSGSEVRWIGYRDEWSGIANVYLDGQLKGTVDTFASPASSSPYCLPRPISRRAPTRLP